MSLSRVYATGMAAVIAAYLAFPGAPRIATYLLVTLGAIPAIAVGIRRSPPDGRRPLWLLLAAMALFNAANLIWIHRVVRLGEANGDGSIADLISATAYVLLLAGAMLIVLRRGRRDIGGVIDAVITALSLGWLAWTLLLQPHLAGAGMPPSQQVGLFLSVSSLMGLIGAVARVVMVAPEPVPAARMLMGALIAAMAGTLAVTLYTDPATHVRPDWTSVPFLISYALLGAAVLHPSAARWTEVGPAPRDDLTAGRLTFLGLMTASIPLIGGVRTMFGAETDGVLIAVGSALVVPLVMVRIARLSAERRAAETALRRMATSDPLTGLPNRTACLEHLDRSLARLGTGGLAVLFCDLDGVKPVNDRLGHAAGDALLVAVADRLRGCVRAEDMVSRFGGDEFVIVCDSARVDSVCDRIRAMVAWPVPVAGEDVRIGVSVGVSYAGRTSTTDEVISRADIAMYEAKRAKSVGALSLATA